MAPTAIKPLSAHVPVDKFEIVIGPSAALCWTAKDVLDSGRTSYSLIFTLRTAASGVAFKRRLRVSSLSAPNDNGDITFIAVFCDQVVSGVYNIQTRKGWFNLD